MAEANIPTAVSNMDVAGICDRTTSYAVEVAKSQSAAQGGVWLPFDRDRVATYLDRLEFYIQTANKTPMDLPKSHNYEQSMLKPFPLNTELESIENQDVKDLLRRLRQLWLECANCQSADLASGINKFDVQRQLAVINSARDVLNMGGESMDLPENPGNIPVPFGSEQNSNNSRRSGNF